MPAVEFLASVPETRSNTSVCLRFVDPAVAGLDDAGQQAFVKGLRRCSKRKRSPTTSPATAMRRRDCAYGAARPSRRPIVEALMPWLDWAFATQKAALKAAA